MVCNCGGNVSIFIDHHRDDTYTGHADCDKCKRNVVYTRDAVGLVLQALEKFFDVDKQGE